MSRKAKCAAAVVAAMMLAACGDNITQPNFQKIKNGMTAAEVEAILGSPTESTAAAGTYKTITGSLQNSTWKSSDGKRIISVSYMNGKVMLVTSSGLAQ